MLAPLFLFGTTVPATKRTIKAFLVEERIDQFTKNEFPNRLNEWMYLFTYCPQDTTPFHVVTGPSHRCLKSCRRPMRQSRETFPTRPSAQKNRVGIHKKESDFLFFFSEIRIQIYCLSSLFVFALIPPTNRATWRQQRLLWRLPRHLCKDTSSMAAVPEALAKQLRWLSKSWSTNFLVPMESSVRLRGKVIVCV